MSTVYHLILWSVDVLGQSPCSNCKLKWNFMSFSYSFYINFSVKVNIHRLIFTSRIVISRWRWRSIACRLFSWYIKFFNQFLSCWHAIVESHPNGNRNGHFICYKADHSCRKCTFLMLRFQLEGLARLDKFTSTTQLA